MKRAALLIAIASLAGCRGDLPSPTVDTGAKETAIGYFTAFANGDAAGAYSNLDSDIRGKVSADAFARQTTAYKRKVGYHVDRVHVQTCEENGDVATAHVVLIGRSAGHSRRFEDAVALRRRDGKWGVVLPANAHR